MADLSSVRSTISSVIQALPSITEIKPEQESALVTFLEGDDVFAVLPTGFGKSLIYQLAVLVNKKISPTTNAIFIVVSPLVELMKEQVKEALQLGISAVWLDDDREADIQGGRCELIFGSPEAWLLNDKWVTMLSNPVYRQNLKGIIVDEVHVTYKWGQGANGKPAFRESFAKLGELRSIVKQGSPVLALTASADMASRDRVRKILHLNDAKQIIVSPNRDNIRLGLAKAPRQPLQCLDWVVNEVRAKGTSMAPIIVYCRTIPAVGEVFRHLKTELGEDLWVNKDPEHKIQNLLVSMFHSKTKTYNKDNVVKSLSGQGNCRVVVATTALGMGLNFPNVSHVVMYGAPEDPEDIVQQVGRAGRNGQKSHAVLYKTRSPVDTVVRELINTSKNSCFRKALYDKFEPSTLSVEPGHLCCSFCHRSCSCATEAGASAASSVACLEPLPVYELEEKVNVPAKKRLVTHEQKMLVKERLERYQHDLGAGHHYLFTSSAACTGFSRYLINAVLENCAYIFTLNDIDNHLPVFSPTHAMYILQIIQDIFLDIEEMPPALPQEESFEEPDIYYRGYFDEADENAECESNKDSSSSSNDDV